MNEHADGGLLGVGDESRNARELAGAPLSPPCAGPIAAKAHACLGISPFNGHFTTERITELAGWALHEFQAVHLFVPDVPAAVTLEALGYSPERAAVKARRQACYLRNKICRALAALDVRTPADLILDWAALTGNPAYRDGLAAVQEAFGSDPDFAASCVQATRWVLEGRLAPEEITTSRLHIAVDYLLAEMPLFLDTAAIVGTPSSVFCYHQSPDFLRSLYARKLAVRPAERQGFAVVSPAEGQAMMQ